MFEVYEMINMAGMNAERYFGVIESQSHERLTC